ncbi:hypothetical protein JCM11672_22290 [Alkaliphilus crotonatoxidans]
MLHINTSAKNFDSLSIKTSIKKGWTPLKFSYFFLITVVHIQVQFGKNMAKGGVYYEYEYKGHDYQKAAGCPGNGS